MPTNIPIIPTSDIRLSELLPPDGYPDIPNTGYGKGKGRPLKINYRIQQDICKHILDGVPQEIACVLAGISRETFFTYMQRGAKEPGSIFDCFAVAIRKAHAEKEASLASKWSSIATNPTRKHKVVYKERVLEDDEGKPVLRNGDPVIIRYKESETTEYTGEGDWRAVEAFLSKRFPERWKSNNSLELTGADGGPLQVQAQVQNVSEVARVVDMLPVDMKMALLQALGGGALEGQNTGGVIDITDQGRGVLASSVAASRLESATGSENIRDIEDAMEFIGALPDEDYDWSGEGDEWEGGD